MDERKLWLISSIYRVTNDDFRVYEVKRPKRSTGRVWNWSINSFYYFPNNPSVVNSIPHRSFIIISELLLNSLFNDECIIVHHKTLFNDALTDHKTHDHQQVINFEFAKRIKN